MKYVFVGFVMIVIMVFGTTNAALAQSAPIGTWQGNFKGSDTGTVTITIDANEKVTADVYSNKYAQHFICTGGLFGSPGAYLFQVYSQSSITPVWLLSAEVNAGQAISNGSWTSGGTQIESGTFNASFTSSSTGGSTAITLGGYMSGNWYNPSQSGHGFELEFTSQASDTPDQNTIVAYWYAYTPNGAGQNWIYAQGSYNTASNTVTLPALLLGGTKFPYPMTNFNSNAIQQTPWGTLTFTFSDCNNGTASWNSSISGYGSGSMPIARLTSVAGTSCP